MAKQLINVGTGPDTKNGDTVRNAFIKVNNNFDELYGAVGMDSSGTITSNFKGSVYDLNDQIMLDAATGKLSNSAVPSIVTIRYEFKVTFGPNGNVATVVDLPLGWSSTNVNNLVTINHSTGRPPAIISYWGYSVTQGLRLRFPTSGYQVTRNGSMPYSFTLNLNSAVTGADNGHYALITVIF